MKIHTINYQKHRKDGTVYNQFVTIDKELQKKYNDRIRYLKSKVNKKIKKEHIYNYDDMKILSYTFTLKKWINCMHITWFYEFYKLVFKHKISEDKNLLLGRNTIIKVL